MKRRGEDGFGSFYPWEVENADSKLTEGRPRQAEFARAVALRDPTPAARRPD